MAQAMQPLASGSCAMRLSVRRRWIWPIGLLASLAAVTCLAALFINEPARRYMEHEINRRLTGYTVTVRALHVHPWTVSLELVDSMIAQDANPDPPVARIRSLTTTIDWRALLHGKVVADMTFDEPALYVNLKNFRTEARSDVPLKDRGWQEALEAVALDLKINRLRVRNGDFTYLDTGPFKPLRLSGLNASAENIRNIKSHDRVYPSDVHVEGVVFDTGEFWLDGRADFLAEPHAGIQAAVRLDRVELDYFQPIIQRYNLSVSRGTLSLTGNIEYAPTITRLILDRVGVQGIYAEYVHTPRTAEIEKARIQRSAEAARRVANKADIDLRIDRLDITRSTLGFVNRARTPEYRLLLTDTNLTVENLGNQRQEGPALIRLGGRFMGTGDTAVTMTLRPRTGGADMDVTARVDEADMARMSSFVRAHGGIDVAAGKLSLYSELRVRDGAITGYVKPLLRDVSVGAVDGEETKTKSFGRRLYERAVGAALKILKNRSRGEVATVATISGRLDQPQFSKWQVIGRLLQNAFIKAILPGFDPKRSPKLDQPPSGHGRDTQARPDDIEPRRP
jgi:uncharacterized protein DUF748